MRFAKKALTIFSVVGLLLAGFNPATASLQVSNQQIDDSPSAGLLVKYANGVDPLTSDGQPLAESIIGVNLNVGANLGEGWVSLRFDENLPTYQANGFASRLSADARIESVRVNAIIQPAAVKSVALKPVAAIIAASPVRSLVVKDVWQEDKPTTAQAQLTWAAPAKLSGAKIAGYQVEVNSGKTWEIVARSNTTERSAVISAGLRPGVNYQFRVRAVTYIGKVQKLGLPSTVAKATFTTAPAAPILASGNTAFGSSSPSWVTQNSIQRGGLSVVYSATAKATGVPSKVCTTTSNTCQFSGLVKGIAYSVQVKASNARGSALSDSAVRPFDAQYDKQWYLNTQWGINAPTAWQTTMGAPSLVVAVIDTGITSHPELDAKVVPGYDFVSDVESAKDGDGWDANATDPGDAFDGAPSSWHGTHVAGIIAAASNADGVAGVAPNVLIQPVRVMGARGATEEDLIAAIRWSAGLAVEGVPSNPTPARVINISMGTPRSTGCRNWDGTDGPTEVALIAAKEAGVVVVTAAGNSNRSANLSYPGNCVPTINVGATGFDGDRASYSNYSIPGSDGNYYGVDISAPGGDSAAPIAGFPVHRGMILSTFNDGKDKPGSPKYEYEEGTSMASPVVAGVAALMLSVKPSMNFVQVVEIMQATVTPFPANSNCSVTRRCGAGIVNAAAALAAVTALP